MICDPGEVTPAAEPICGIKTTPAATMTPINASLCSMTDVPPMNRLKNCLVVSDPLVLLQR